MIPKRRQVWQPLIQRRGVALFLLKKTKTKKQYSELSHVATLLKVGACLKDRTLGSTPERLDQAFLLAKCSGDGRCSKVQEALQSSCPPSVGHRSVSLGRCWKCIFIPIPDPLSQTFGGLDPTDCCNKLTSCFWCTLMFERPWLRVGVCFLQMKTSGFKSMVSWNSDELLGNQDWKHVRRKIGEVAQEENWRKLKGLSLLPKCTSKVICIKMLPGENFFILLCMIDLKES